jgi:hypothetical protein
MRITMDLTPLQQAVARNRARGISEQTEHQGADRPPEYPPSEQVPASERQRVIQPFNFKSLPSELRQMVLRNNLAQPNRRDAHDELANLMTVSRSMADLLLQMEESAALQRNPGIESRYIAVCRDVVHGIPVKDALRQNGPLPEAEELDAEEVMDALRNLTPEELADLNVASEDLSNFKITAKKLADLVDAFSRGAESTSKGLLTGVAWAAVPEGTVAGPLDAADIHNLSNLTKAFTRNDLALEDGGVAGAIEWIAWQVVDRGPTLLPEANIQQISTLAEAFSIHQDYPHIHEDETFEKAIEALAEHINTRRDELLSTAKVEEIAMLAEAFKRAGEVHAVWLLASHMTQRSNLFDEASADQLVTLKAAFTGFGNEIVRSALAKVDEQIAKDREASVPSPEIKNRPQLDNRDDRARAVER